MKHIFLYMSPAGTTDRVVRVIADRLRQETVKPEFFIVGNAESGRAIAVSLAGLTGPVCLWVGSPVYVDHALPNLIEVVRSLRAPANAFGAAFVTYGGVTTGTALHELLDVLEERGFVPLGGMKVLCRHSSFRADHEPLAAGHPDPSDKALIVAFAEAVLARLSAGGKPLPRSLFEYQTEAMKALAGQVNLAKIKTMGELPPVDPAQCNQCGLCAKSCPVKAIKLSPFPQRHSECIRCLVCVRTCPRQAWPFDFAAHETMLRGMAARSDEKAETRIFPA